MTKRINDPPKRCEYCHEIFYRGHKQSELKNRNNWVKRRFCSNRCSARSRPLVENPEYSTLHYWVRSQLGRPQQCENCGTGDAPRFEWANISGQYKRDLTDWVRLCKMCHTLIDNGQRIYFGRKS